MLSSNYYSYFLKINIENFFFFFKLFHKIKIKILGFDIKFLIHKKDILNYLFFLKKNSTFLYTTLIDLIVEDFPKKKKRYVIKYFIRSIVYSKIIQITLQIKEYKSIYSIINLYKSSFWLEREVWDMYGIFFLFNKDLRRLLTDYGFKGNPLKKDFPLIGFLEINFDFFWKKLKYNKIKNTQKKHNFFINKIFKIKKKNYK